MDSVDVESLVGSVLRGVLGGGRKQSGGALRDLTNGRSSFLTASTLLTGASECAAGGLVRGDRPHRQPGL